MIFTITKIRRTPKPSTYKPGTFWNLTEIKTKELGEQILELVGFGKDADKLVEGSSIRGYLSQKTWNNVVTKTLNKITPDYLYDLILKINPGIESVSAHDEVNSSTEADWTTPPLEKNNSTTAQDDPEF